MGEVKIADGVYWVGAIDWNIRFCGSYGTPLGTTYNAYLIKGEKIVLVDTVKESFFEEMLSRIKELVNWCASPASERGEEHQGNRLREGKRKSQKAL